MGKILQVSQFDEVLNLVFQDNSLFNLVSLVVWYRQRLQKSALGGVLALFGVARILVVKA